MPDRGAVHMHVLQIGGAAEQAVDLQVE